MSSVLMKLPGVVSMPMTIKICTRVIWKADRLTEVYSQCQEMQALSSTATSSSIHVKTCCKSTFSSLCHPASVTMLPFTIAGLPIYQGGNYQNLHQNCSPST